MIKLLQGIRVLDLTRLLPGPLCTRYLADLGAEVLKIEAPEGDYVRFIPPLAKKNSYVFLQLNHGKNLKTLDLKTREHREIFLDLVRESQVVVESFRPGVAADLGIDFESLKQVNPSLVYCSITGYGQTGPYRDRAGHDINYLATAGILHQMGSLANFQIADVAGGSLSACVGILAALIDAQRTGKSRYLDVSMLDCVMGLNQVALATYQGSGQDLGPRADLLNGGSPFYNVYETSDSRFIALGAMEKKFWKNFCLAVERPEWMVWHGKPPEKYPQMISEIAALFKSKSLLVWTRLLEDKDCCASPVLKISEALEDPQVRARQMVLRRDHGEDGEALSFKFPIIPY